MNAIYTYRYISSSLFSNLLGVGAGRRLYESIILIHAVTKTCDRRKWLVAGEEDGGGKSRMAAAVATRLRSRAFAPRALWTSVGQTVRPSVTNRRGCYSPFDLRSGGTTR